MQLFKRKSSSEVPLSEADLVKGCQSGKADCQKALYDRTARKMMGVCIRYFPDRADAEDVLQNAYIRVFNKIGQFKGEGSLEGWIRRIVVSTAIDQLRKNKSKGFTETIDDLPADPSSEDRLPQDTELLLQALQALPEGYRAVFNLFAMEGYAHAEIAEMLGISVGTSKSQLSHARNFLRKWLKNHHPEIYAQQEKVI